MPMRPLTARFMMFVSLFLGGAACSGGAAVRSDVGIHPDGSLPGATDAASSSPEARPSLSDGATTPSDAEPDAAPIPDLAGLVLWLDATTGLVQNDRGVITAWRDRSSWRHEFTMHALADPRPQRTMLEQGAAVRFDGHPRFVLPPTAPAENRAALALRTNDFVLGLAVRGPKTAENGILFAHFPYVGGPNEPIVSIPPLQHTLLVEFGNNISVRMAEHGLTAPRTDVRNTQVILVVAIGSTLALRIDGQEKARNARARLSPDGALIDLPEQTTFIGGWDFDLPALEGMIADVVLVKGTSSAAAVQPLEKHLLAKHRPR